MASPQLRSEMAASPSIRMADLLQANHDLVLMLPRFGIRLGFGERSVAEVCAESGVSPQFFLMVCRFYVFDTYRPSAAELEAMDLQGVLSYLTTSHRYYREDRIPHIAAHLRHIADGCPGQLGTALMRFATSYQRRVERHLKNEENTLFRRLAALAEGRVFQAPASRYDRQHGDIATDLQDLTSILIKYLPEDILQQERVKVLDDIFHLSEDLRRHSLIEEHLLMPYIKLKEAQ
ncbi:MAG: hemerythrin domain-containing protein [Bacteroidales bacterium]|nr:hemerythrin domain-containing protein [Bacteroidales bacterium]